MADVLRTNRIMQAAREGRQSFGIYVKTPSTMMVEMLGFAGFDFLRIDLNAGHINTETVADMIRTCHAVGVTPVIRVERNDALQIQQAIDMGALGIIVPEVESAADVQAAIRAAKLPPHGDRHPGTSGFAGGYGAATLAEYTAWAEQNIMLSVQVETRGAVEEVEQIAALPGLDMIQGGRGTLSYNFGVPGQQYHPSIMEIERTVMDTAQRAGKLIGLQYYPWRDRQHIAIVQEWARRGAQCLCLGTDTDLVFTFRNLLSELRSGI